MLLLPSLDVDAMEKAVEGREKADVPDIDALAIN